MDMQANDPILLINGLGAMQQNGDNGSVQSSPSSPSSSAMLQGGRGQQPIISVILTIRLLMQGKEVGSIIGKRGDHIKIIRDESNAKINISDGSCPERIVTITGNVETVKKAFTMICRKFQDDMHQLPNGVPKPPITFRLIVPATQCGSLIGKGGSKIKEIREATGASIQVASEMLPSSTERAVTISGTAEAIILCMHQICQILLESPPKGATISYRPKPAINQLLLATSAAAAAAAHQQPCSTTVLPQNPFCQITNELTKIHPLNQLLPAVNPTALAGNAFPATGNVLSLPVSAACQSALYAPKLAMTGSGSSAKNGDALTSYAGRLEPDIHWNAPNDNFSQHVVNSSPIRVSAATNTSGSDISYHVSNSSTSTSTLSQSRQLSVAVSSPPSAVSLSNPVLAAAVAMASTKARSQNLQSRHHQLLHTAAALTGAAVRPAVVSQQPFIQSGMPISYYQSSIDPPVSADSLQSTPLAATHQQAALAWINMLMANQANQASSISLNSTPSTSQVAMLPLSGLGSSALWLNPATNQQHVLYPVQQQHNQLLALHQAAAASMNGTSGGPVMNAVGEKLVKRFTPY